LNRTLNKAMSALSFTPVSVVRAAAAPNGVARRTASRASAFRGSVKAFHPLG
jgi:hypothetical protein